MNMKPNDPFNLKVHTQKNYLIKTNRVFTLTRKFAWLFILLVVGGGLFEPKLGLFLIPLMLALIVMGLLKGKFWCGNICPHGSLFDYIIMPISRNGKIPKFFKSKIFIAIAFTWFMLMLFLRIKKVVGIWGTTPFIDKLGFIFVMNYLVVTVAGLFLAIFVTPRTWCSFCPMGTFEKLSYKLGKKLKINNNTDKKITVEHIDKCHTCAKCARVCPMQLNPYLEFNKETGQIENEDCIRCETCVINCPAHILTSTTNEKAIQLQQNTNLTGYNQKKEAKAKIENIKKLTTDTWEYTFKILDGEVNYNAGQFILLKIQSEPLMYRAYSISSDKIDPTLVKVAIKKDEQGYGTGIIFNTFHIGDTIDIVGPMGHELLLDKQSNELLFIGGGIGITPFVPLVKEALKNNAKNIKLIHGVNKESELIYQEYFNQISAENPHFEYIPVAAFDEGWSGKKGLVTDVIKELELKEPTVYMCGSKPMINASIKTLKQLKVKESNIFYESA